jgi:hypothetical protein
VATVIAYGEIHAVLASHILRIGALQGGMPLYKFRSNRILTLIENLLLGHMFSEYIPDAELFPGRYWKGSGLTKNQMTLFLTTRCWHRSSGLAHRIGEVSCPTKNFEEVSSVSFWRSVIYGFGVFNTALQFHLGKWGFPSRSIIRK